MRGGRRGGVDDSPDTSNQVLDVEVDEKPERIACDSQVTEQLRSVKRQDFRNGFQFDDQTPFDQQVEAQVRTQAYAIVLHWDQDFTFELHPGLVELNLQALRIDGFEQTRTERSMNCDRRTDHPTRQSILRVLCAL